MDCSLKDGFFKFIKSTGLIYPTKSVWRPFGKYLEVDRCVADGGLVSDSQSSLSRHCGHSMRGPVRVTLFEMVLIWIRFIR